MVSTYKIYNILSNIYRAIFRDRQILVNFLFQKILRINAKFQFPVHFTTQIVCPENIKVRGGDKLYASFAKSGSCYFSAVNGIEFGENVLFAPGIKIISSNHDFTKSREPIKSPPIVIEDDVWIGANAVLLAGIRIGSRSVIAAGAVVTKSMPSRAIIAGVPAKVIGYICNCGGKVQDPNETCPACGKNTFH